VTAEQFCTTLRAVGMTQVAAAKALHVQVTTVNRWARGTRKVPGPVVAALECWQVHADVLARAVAAMDMDAFTRQAFLQITLNHHHGDAATLRELRRQALLDALLAAR
jgi:DNA-binding transcriptional regulator YdaS (Cro superfamily)